MVKPDQELALIKKGHIKQGCISQVAASFRHPRHKGGTHNMARAPQRLLPSRAGKPLLATARKGHREVLNGTVTALHTPKTRDY